MIAVVTGAGGGLGAAVARRLATDGTAVACADIDAAAAEATAAGLRAEGRSAAGYGVDVTSEAALARLREAVHRDLGRPSALMNIAGILDRGQLADLDGAAFRRVVDVNLTGTYLAVRAFAGDLRDAPRGRIVNTASIAAVNGYPFPAYSASKAAVAQLTRSLLFDFWRTAVTVNGVCPGPMRTSMLDESAEAAFLDRTPAHRIATPEEVAEVFAFLAGPAADCVNGQNIVVDGGATAVFRWQPQAAGPRAEEESR
ncbi:SDR family NAD(P)-dependent oxidoreductase [Streptomyces sp. PTD5-9]|uniref:SDR family NAD(P)-dependent oxidoreductase n=1 Tax=Streptomyces sp. PTD5-9 TaxID=3120150 RepID=UPI003008811E